MPGSIVDLISSGHIGNQAGGYEPQRINSIILVIPGLGNAGEELSLSLQQFTIPIMLGQSNTVMIQRGLIAKKFAGNVQYNQLTFDFHDYVDRATAETLLRWRSQVYNPITKQVRAAALYKKSCDVHFIGPEGTRNRSLTLQGLFPLSVDFGQANLSDDNLLMIQTLFDYDECLPGRGFDSTSFQLSAGITFSAGLSANVGFGGNIGGSIGLSGGVNVGF